MLFNKSQSNNNDDPKIGFEIKIRLTSFIQFFLSVSFHLLLLLLHPLLILKIIIDILINYHKNIIIIVKQFPSLSSNISVPIITIIITIQRKREKKISLLQQ